jgi:hypothetical protein
MTISAQHTSSARQTGEKRKEQIPIRIKITTRN